MKHTILIIGSGGREHALAWKLSQSPQVGKIFVAPGNGGTSQIAENIPIQPTDIDRLVEFAREKSIDLTVVGPDDALAHGIVDAFQARGLRIFGPTRAAAAIESSKRFAKELMRRAGIPTAEFKTFQGFDDAWAYTQKRVLPVVIKASGLALGKGVYVCHTFAEAEQALRELLVEQVHKEAGTEVVVEEFLLGQEVSIHAVSDGKTAVLFPPAQDHKTIGEQDTGKNTGGMGSVVPVPWVSAETLTMLQRQIVQPALNALAQPFIGCLFPGLMMTPTGFKVLEFNARFGDPETQSYMRLLKTDLFEILNACVNGTLAQIKVEWHSGFAACVVLASGGYPDKYTKGLPIHGLTQAEQVPGVVVFHAGTAWVPDLQTAGGRVLGVSAVGDTLREALDRVYQAVDLITFKGKYFRRDIGAQVLAG